MKINFLFSDLSNYNIKINSISNDLVPNLDLNN